jgi:hypothetical protein
MARRGGPAALEALKRADGYRVDSDPDDRA